MGQRTLEERSIQNFTVYLRNEECAVATVEKYQRDTREFAVWLDDREVSKEAVLDWREHLMCEGRSPVTVNAKLPALNSLFSLLGWTDCRVKYLKIQRRIFRDSSRELTKGDFERLLETARSLGRERIHLIMETIPIVNDNLNTYDGKQNNISNLYVDEPSGSGGLFGKVEVAGGDPAIVWRVRLTDAAVKGSGSAAALAGSAKKHHFHRYPRCQCNGDGER